MPKMIPLLLTGILYWLVKKGVHPIVIVIACFIIGIILNYFGIFGCCLKWSELIKISLFIDY